MARDAAALGHLGLLLGLFAVMLLVWEIYVAVGNVNGPFYFFGPALVWAIGVFFVIVEWFVARRSP